jgi:phosphatidylinositol alpha-1,6-mannosyltransferase
LHVLVAGGGELLDDYRRMGSELLGERAHFAGAVAHEELPAVMRAGDFLLLTTEPPESFGIVLIEAMACGLPVVASDYPGVTAVIDDGTGKLVRGQEETSAAIREMVEIGDEGRRRMGQAGRAKCERTWAWPRLVERMDEVYAEAIEHHGGRG